MKKPEMSDTIPDMNWRDKLAKAMEDRGMTQYRMEQLTGLRQSRISLWLRGQGEPGLMEWVKMSEALDVPLSWFTDSGTQAPPDFRTPEEQMLVRVARKVGIEQIWEIIAEAAVNRREAQRPSSGPLGFVREVTESPRQDAEAPEPEPKPEPKKPRR